MNIKKYFYCIENKTTSKYFVDHWWDPNKEHSFVESVKEASKYRKAEDALKKIQESKLGDCKVYFYLYYEAWTKIREVVPFLVDTETTISEEEFHA